MIVALNRLPLPSRSASTRSWQTVSSWRRPRPHCFRPESIASGETRMKVAGPGLWAH
ncbi:uncharacterized protein SCHCODRAFT_02537488 [Schizophyllum commune H4-8]|uniref:uncharacterized protein n=1 Tax=Schizophyllum commune (strain H4-8 / FGSC 9210) TaxID=578458 RepID=UPI00215DFCB6|nr:uncharacterized protein SCHCODRAFT_02537488 [Schizophyllum commune H4-8]KAI5892979.1 hypothetical protein SCHCODRAFT_02537488 [Schizophyllum commune H4-8]